MWKGDAARRIEPAMARIGGEAVDECSIAADETHQRLAAEVEAEFDARPFRQRHRLVEFEAMDAVAVAPSFADGDLPPRAVRADFQEWTEMPAGLQLECLQLIHPGSDMVGKLFQASLAVAVGTHV